MKHGSRMRLFSIFTVMWVGASLLGLFAGSAFAQSGDTKMLIGGVEVSYNSPHLPGCEFDIQWDGFSANQVVNYTFSSQSPTLGGVFIDEMKTLDGNGHGVAHVSFNSATLAGVTPQPNQNYHITLIGDTIGSSTKGKTFWIERACGGLPPVVDVCPNIDGDQAVVPDGLVTDQNGNCIPPTDLCPNIDGAQDTVPLGLITDANGNCVPPTDVCPNLQGAQDQVPDGYTVDANGDCQPPDAADFCPNIDGDQAAVPDGMEVDADGNCVTPAEPTDDCPNIDGNQVDLPNGYVFDADGNCVKPKDEVLGKTHFNAKPDKKPQVKAENAKPDKKVLPFTGSETAPWVALGSLLLLSGLGFLYLQRKSEQFEL